MKALLDTNIIIHRENTKATNYSIGQLFHWLDKMHYEKVLHPYTVKELRKLHNDQMQDLYDAKLDAYTLLHTVAPQTDEFKRIIAGSEKTENDVIDNQLLCEVYSGRVDILITEDRKMRNKAESLGIANKVFSINSFITKMTDENPALIEYKALSVKKHILAKSMFSTASLILSEIRMLTLINGLTSKVMKRHTFAITIRRIFLAFFI